MRLNNGLTGAQDRVAALKRTGMTNARIARALFMTVKGVECQVTALYRHYGVRDAAALNAVYRSPEASVRAAYVDSIMFI
jgi:DNA-binding NarL/FixJ family response regulator